MEHQEAPPGWKVWIARYIPHRWPGRWLHFTVPILEGSDVSGDPADRLKPVNTQSTTFIIGEVTVHTLSSASQPIVDRWQWPAESRLNWLAARISPARESMLAWPPESLRDDEADLVANGFSRMIDAASRSVTGLRLFKRRLLRTVRAGGYVTAWAAGRTPGGLDKLPQTGRY